MLESSLTASLSRAAWPVQTHEQSSSLRSRIWQWRKLLSFVVQKCRIFQTMLLCGYNKSTKYFCKLTAVKIECKSWSRILRNNQRIRLEVVLSLQHNLCSLRQLSEWGNGRLIRHLIRIMTDSEDLELVGHLLNLQKVQTTFLSTLIKQLHNQVSYRITRLKFRSKRILAKRQKKYRKILQNRRSY